jgi:hypothetical protein
MNYHHSWKKKRFLRIFSSGHHWIIPIILATQEVKIRKITAWVNSSGDPISKIPNTKKGW